MLSAPQLIDGTKCTVKFTNLFCVMQDRCSGSLIGAGERRGGLYFYRGIHVVHDVRVPDKDGFALWHRRMGHPSDRVVMMIPTFRNSSSSHNLHKVCEVCPQAKQHRHSFPLSNSRASSKFELIHYDLWGPYRTLSTCGAQYFLSFVDDYTRGVWVYLLKSKTEVHSVFCSFLALVKQKFGVDVKYARSDNGIEFQCMHDYFHNHGIIFQTSCVRTPQQNGRVERKHQRVLNVSRALMFQADLPVCSFLGKMCLECCLFD